MPRLIGIPASGPGHRLSLIAGIAVGVLLLALIVFSN
jgi:hypothetical protein